eukprot:TRINITY_DN27434_c0_g1_i1.p1 TRINITY_DN27434_c0_g1~~TRINITY_DN27434_c0_g1_i1.p1  ORF type:complete len:1259 (+),score=188.78 TRINITY_DN27434_c0_g1_i1:231-4007(+)
MAGKARVVSLPSQVEDRLKLFFRIIDVGGDGTVEPRELMRACQENDEIASFFGLDNCEDPATIKTFFDGVDTNGSRSVDFAELRYWYFHVWLNLRGRKMETQVLSDPVWIAHGGQRNPSMPLRRVSTDDLYEALLRGDIGLTRRLVEAGASVNCPMRPNSSNEYMTVLHVLACLPKLKNCRDIMAELLHRDADVDARSSIGTSPLILACEHRHVEAVEVLLEYGADAGSVDDYGRYPAGCLASASLRTGTGKLTQTTRDGQTNQLVHVLARWGADLNVCNHEMRPPIAEAIKRGSWDLVETLLSCGAMPLGLHEAIEAKNLHIINKLMEALANPFLRDMEGLTCMERALSTDNADIREAIRDFVGKLEREHHPHLNTLENDGVPGGDVNMRQSCGVGPIGDMAPQAETSPTCKKRFQRHCRVFNLNKYFQAFMLIVLVAALFMPDLYVVFQATDATTLDWLLVCILALFFFEFMLQIVGSWDKYTCTFFFWMDILGMLSVPLDHSIITNSVMVSMKGIDNSVFMRATRMAKLGSRAGRFTKLIKLLRFLPSLRSTESKASSMVKNVAAKINTTLSMRIACLIICSFITLPIFDLFRFPLTDHSMMAWVQTLDHTAMSFPNSTVEVIDDFHTFYTSTNLNYFPYEVIVTFQNSSTTRFRLDADEPIRSVDMGVFHHTSVIVYFNFAAPNRVDSILNLLLIVMIAIMMGSSAQIVSSAVSRIVLAPVEKLMSCVHRITGMIFKSVVTMSSRIPKKDQEGAVERELSQDEDFAHELFLLSRTLKKLQVLADIALRKKGLEDSTLGDITAGDRALLEQLVKDGVESPQELSDSKDEPQRVEEVCYEDDFVHEFVSKQLLEVDVVMEDLSGWDYSVVSLTERQKNAVCIAVMTLQARRDNFDHEVGASLTQVYTNFVMEVSKGYGSPKQVPYTNWNHAVDVAFSLHSIFTRCSAEKYLGANERFALVVAGICHDIGHRGRSNAFLVETKHEIAMRYNDISPLEHYHAAKMFEIASQEKTNIFKQFERAQYKDVRLVCIEAILGTDNSKHGNMVNDMQMIEESHTAVLDAAAEDHAAGTDNWPSREVIDLLRAQDTKKLLRSFYIHFCDVSSPTKSWARCEYWGVHISEEFFMQGDVERQLGIPIILLNDRQKANVAHCQIGFIEFIVAPLVVHTIKLFPPLSHCQKAAISNISIWFSKWVSTESPPEEEQEKMLERLGKVKETLGDQRVDSKCKGRDLKSTTTIQARNRASRGVSTRRTTLLT